MKFRNYKNAQNAFPEFHGVFPELHDLQWYNSEIRYLKNICKTCFQEYMVISHITPELHECTKMHFWNYMVYFQKYMFDNHVIPKLHNWKYHKRCFQAYMDCSHITLEIHECMKMHFHNYMLYFWKYMADNNVIPKLCNCKTSSKDVFEITWLLAI